MGYRARIAASNEGRRRAWSLLFLECLVIAAITLTYCSRSSFWYVFNNWDDSNIYFTMGKALMNGLVPYRDLYEQKGPYLYLVYGIGYLFSHTTFHGVFILEIIAATFFLFAQARLLGLVLQPQTIALCLPFLGAGVYSSLAFYWGGSAEELFLPVMAFILYLVMRDLSARSSDLTLRHAFIIGILSGVLGCTKYLWLGLVLGALMGIFILDLIRRKWRSLLKEILWFLAGYALAVLPWFLYFGYHHAIDDWFTCYIYNNVTAYGGGITTPSELIYNVYEVFRYNLGWSVFLILGVLAVLLMRRFTAAQKLVYVLMLLCTVFAMYGEGMTLYYYAMPLTVFAGMGYVPIGWLLEKLTTRIHRGKFGYVLTVVSSLVCLVLATLFGLHTSENVAYHSETEDSLFLYRFRDEILADEDTSQVCLTLDVGLYTLTDTLPSCYYFCVNNQVLDAQTEAVNGYVADAVTDFVITKNSEPAGISDHYELIDSEVYDNGRAVNTYRLYQRRD